jgi:hypothetical protein
MSGWLARATGALRGETADEPQPFELVCECGMRHSGLRRRKAQRIVCRSCGASLFILPRDPYPAPTALPVRKKKRRRKRKSQPVAAKPAPRVRIRAAGEQIVRKTASGMAHASTRVRAGTAAAGLGLWRHLLGWASAVRSFWTPFRLTVAAIALLIVATLAWTVRSRSHEQAIRDLKTADEAARTALAAGDFAAAQAPLARAVAALDALGRHDDPLARELRQSHRESTALLRISAVSPFELAVEAEHVVTEQSPSEWSERFAARYAGVWTVIEGSVRRSGSDPAGPRYAFDVPFFAIGAARRGLTIEGPLAALDALQIGSEPRPVVLAAQLAELTLNADDNVWELRLRPETAFLWANVDSYQALGFTFDDPESEQRVRDILRAQSQTQGIN